MEIPPERKVIPESNPVFILLNVPCIHIKTQEEKYFEMMIQAKNQHHADVLYGDSYDDIEEDVMKAVHKRYRNKQWQLHGQIKRLFSYGKDFKDRETVHLDIPQCTCKECRNKVKKKSSIKVTPKED